MLLYLDLNCFNRPFDDQRQERVAREAAAVLWILGRVVEGEDQLVWSEILDFEAAQHPLTARRAEISSWGGRAGVHVAIDDPLASRARELVDAGLAPLDAAHVASAERAGCDAFLTCDDRLIKRYRRVDRPLSVLSPLEYVARYESG